MHKVWTLACLLWAATGRVYSGETEGHAARYDGDSFAITLPAGWKEIPATVLNNYSDTMAQLAPGAPRQEYQCGFQLASALQWFTYPYVLVQIRNTGRVPEAQFSKTARIKGAVEKGLKETESQLSSVLSESSLAEPVYDPEKHAMWMNGSMNIAGVGKVRMSSGTFLTEKGTLSVFCYAKENDFATYTKPFQTILSSLQLSEELRYKPRPSDKSSARGFLDQVGGGALRGAIIGAIVGAIVGVVIMLLKRKKASA